MQLRARLAWPASILPDEATACRLCLAEPRLAGARQPEGRNVDARAVRLTHCHPAWLS